MATFPDLPNNLEIWSTSKSKKLGLLALLVVQVHAVGKLLDGGRKLELRDVRRDDGDESRDDDRDFGVTLPSVWSEVGDDIVTYIYKCDEIC